MKKIYSLVAVLAVAFSANAQTSVTVQFSTLGLTDQADNPSGVIDSNISFTTAQNSGSTPTRYFTNGGAIRMYPGAGNGGSITFTLAEGVTVTDFSATATATYAQPATYSINGGAEIATTATNDVYTLTGLNATNSFEFTNANTNATGGANQLRLTSVSFTYTIASESVAELTPSVTSLTGLNYTENNGPSEVQTFNISGTNVSDSAVLINASENFEVSSDNDFFGFLASLTPYDGTSTPVYVRLAAGLPAGTYNGELVITGGGITTPITIPVSGEVETTASIVENNIEGLKVYPNPASDLVNIVSNEIGTKEVVIFNMLGKKVLETSTEETVNVSTLTSGVYIMNITQDGKNASRKLVIK